MRRVVLSLLFVACVGCEEELAPPEIGMDIPMTEAGEYVANLGIHVVDSDAGPYEFNLQLVNKGEEKLVIESVSYRGDQNCSLALEGPDVMEMGENESAFLHGSYDPTILGEDQIAMEVVSNASNYPRLVVPICGKAVLPGTEDAGMPECQVPPQEQPDCPVP
jgi:hypothetical protein